MASLLDGVVEEAEEEEEDSGAWDSLVLAALASASIANLNSSGISHNRSNVLTLP